MSVSSKSILSITVPRDTKSFAFISSPKILATIKPLSFAFPRIISSSMFSISPKNLTKNLPSVVTTSDSGSGIGYSSIMIRGSDQTRVNVTINGVPYNDSESMMSYWVNLPDLSSSIESIQVQRGVGTSTNGSAAFGGSINILTNAASDKASFEINNTLGSFNTVKNSVGFSTGFINDKFELSGRLSRIKSSGYIDRSGSKLKSYFLQGIYKDENTLLKILNFAGHEITDQAWFGVDSSTLETNRKYNPAGEYYDKMGNTLYYNNQDDNYKQDHYQFHWNQKLNEKWSTNLGLNHTYGRGYFEQFREDDSIDIYGGILVSDIDQQGNQTGTTDLIRRRWLDNNFYVLNASVNYKTSKLDLIFNSSYSTYSGDHYGEVIWARNFSKNSSVRDRYYDGNGKKTDFSVFAKASYLLNEKLEFYGDLQLRKLNYKTSGITSDLVNMLIDQTYSFFNPKFGLSLTLSPASMLYGSFSRANREPSRSDFESNINIKPEQLNDFEFGWRFKKNGLKLNLNAFYMLYNEQLVLTGELDDVGTPIRTNSGSSYRKGIEFEAGLKLSESFLINSNLTLSSNKNKQILSNFDGAIFDFGKTSISFSPDLIASNSLIFSPNDNTMISFLSKYVGKQYMGNTDAVNSILDSYFVNNINFSYTLSSNSIFDEIIISGLINNVFDKKYVSNGYYYTYEDTWSSPGQIKTLDGAGYYPQAERNFLIGLTLKL